MARITHHTLETVTRPRNPIMEQIIITPNLGKTILCPLPTHQNFLGIRITTATFKDTVMIIIS